MSDHIKSPSSAPQNVVSEDQLIRFNPDSWNSVVHHSEDAFQRYVKKLRMLQVTQQNAEANAESAEEKSYNENKSNQTELDLNRMIHDHAFGFNSRITQKKLRQDIESTLTFLIMQSRHEGVAVILKNWQEGLQEQEKIVKRAQQRRRVLAQNLKSDEKLSRELEIENKNLTKAQTRIRIIQEEMRKAANRIKFTETVNLAREQPASLLENNFGSEPENLPRRYGLKTPDNYKNNLVENYANIQQAVQDKM